MYGYDALRQSAAWFDLSARGRIAAFGEDRRRLLHAMCTNHVQQLPPGGHLYAFFLNAQGRVFSDAWILAGPDHLLISVEPETRGKILAHLDRFIIADDVTLEDRTETTVEIAVEGPRAIEHAPLAGGFRAAAISATGLPGLRIFAPLAARDELRARLAALPEANAEAVRTVRLENGVPRYGDDITEAQIAHETQQLHALHFNKGCYLGQEIVERVRSRGHVNRRLVALRIGAASPPAPGAKVEAGEGREAGQVTSAAFSPAEQCVRALAYVRAEFLKPGVSLAAGGAPAEVFQQARAESVRHSF
jgi:aminomethyltransferase